MFSDACDTGYGIACYARFVNNSERIHCALVYGRTRVAPLKFISIPRMELTAAVLSAKSHRMLKNEFDIAFDEIHFWTDSQVVLGYINNQARTFKTFVANRVQQIHDLTEC